MKTVLVVIGLGLCLVGCGEKEPLTLEQKAEAGDAKAQFNLGVMYRDGEGVSRDYKEALKWYRKVALQGGAKAQSALGEMYATGRGVEKVFKEAVKWFRKAALQGNAVSQSNLGVAYRAGNGVSKDYVNAYAWHTIAAANGYADTKKKEANLAKEMTPNQIAKAVALAKEMIAKNPKLIRKKD